MFYALLNGVRVEPEKGLEGAVCPFCRQPVIARCGEERVKHWSHRSVIDCDPWLEAETEWHRRWKNLFGDMQEQMHENGGARHMADVKTTDGTIVEFRHNAISREGCATREAFFGKTMFWVVDCARNGRLTERLNENRYRLRTSNVLGCLMQSTREPEKCFPKVWTESRRFVFLDYGMPELICIFPGRMKGLLLCMTMQKDEFVECVNDGYAKFREKCVRVWREMKRSTDNVYERILARAPISSASAWNSNPSPVHREYQKPRPVSLMAPSSPKPKMDIWPENFDHAVTLALTVDPVSASLISQGRISEVETTSIIDGDAAAVGCCALHCSTECSTQALYWAKRRIANEYGKNMLTSVPADITLKGNSGSFFGTVEYSVKDRPNGKVNLSLRNFNPIPPIPPHRFSRECLWPLAPDQLAYFV